MTRIENGKIIIECGVSQILRYNHIFHIFRREEGQEDITKKELEKFEQKFSHILSSDNYEIKEEKINNHYYQMMRLRDNIYIIYMKNREIMDGNGFSIKYNGKVFYMITRGANYNFEIKDFNGKFSEIYNFIKPTKLFDNFDLTTLMEIDLKNFND